MCLDNEKRVSKKKASGNGWKVFVMIDGGLASACGFARNLPREKWLDEKDYRPSKCRRPASGYGWNVFLHKTKGPYGGELVSVKYRGAKKRGTHVGHPMILAKEIFIEQ